MATMTAAVMRSAAVTTAGVSFFTMFVVVMITSDLGIEIQFHQKDDVEYRNLLMPPGTIIKQWYSKTNFQLQ